MIAPDMTAPDTPTRGHGRITRTRALDWLIGAVGMLLVLVLLAGILWVAFSRPADDASPGSAASGTGTTPTAVPTPAPAPPPGLPTDEVWLGDIELESGAIVAAGTMLRDVRATGIDVVSGAEGILAARLAVDATVPFEVVGDELGEDTVVGPGEDGEARVVRTVAALGRELDVVATGTVEVAAGRLVVEPTSIDVGGPAFLADLLASIVREFVTIEHEIEGLPEGLVLKSVRVQDDGFRAHLEGRDVRVATAP